MAYKQSPLLERPHEAPATRGEDASMESTIVEAVASAATPVPTAMDKAKTKTLDMNIAGFDFRR
jgi:hypothetical protein